MPTNLDDWAGQLREYIASCRDAAPLPDREKLTHIEERHCQITGGSFIGGLRGAGPDFLKQRAAKVQMSEVLTRRVTV